MISSGTIVFRSGQHSQACIRRLVLPRSATSPARRDVAKSDTSCAYRARIATYLFERLASARRYRNGDALFCYAGVVAWRSLSRRRLLGVRLLHRYVAARLRHSGRGIGLRPLAGIVDSCCLCRGGHRARSCAMRLRGGIGSHTETGFGVNAAVAHVATGVARITSTKSSDDMRPDAPGGDRIEAGRGRGSGGPDVAEASCRPAAAGGGELK
jgi:hypothetical protein